MEISSRQVAAIRRMKLQALKRDGKGEHKTTNTQYYPPPNVSDSIKDNTTTSLFSLIQISLQYPREHIGVIFILTLCIIGFMLTNISGLSIPSIQSQTSSLNSLTSCNKLLSEIEKLRMEIHHLRVNMGNQCGVCVKPTT